MSAMTMDGSKSQLKSYWKERRPSGVSFLCPLCKSGRVVPHKPSPGLKHFGQVLISSLFVTALTWNWFEWKGIMSFGPLWIAFEVIYRMRARAHLACPHCGFDPYLQLTDAQRARQEMEAHWRKKFAEKGIEFPDQNGKSALNVQKIEDSSVTRSAIKGLASAQGSTDLTQ